MKPHHFRLAGRWTGLVVTGAAVAVVFFALGAFLRLLAGPVSLGPFSGELSAAIDQAVPGLAVRYDSAGLQWSRDEGRVNLVVLGARVFDRGQRIIAQAPKAEIDLAAPPLLEGRVVVKRIALIGVQLTLVHTMDGALRLGIERDREQSDLLERLRKALSSGGGASSLRSFAVRHARLAFYDERTGMFLVAPQASLQISTGPGAKGAKAGSVVANVDADVEISGHASHLVAKVTLPRDADRVEGDISIRGLDINAIGDNAKALAFLKPYHLKTDLTGSFILDHGSTRLRYADFGLGAAGTVLGFGHPVRVKSLKLVGRYDGRTGRLLIDDGSLEGKEARAHLTGSGDLDFNASGGLEKGSVDLTMDKIGVDMPGIMQRAVTLARASLRATYTPDRHLIQIDKFLLSGGPLSASLDGTVTLSPGQTPAIAVSGRVGRLSTADLLHYWPLRLGEGAREWLAENVAAGSIGPVTLKTDIAAGALDRPALPDDAVHLGFPIENATITYLKGLTPLSGARGSGTLTGDTFKAEIASASVGPLAVTGGSVVIPNLHVAGSAGDIKAHVEGRLSDVLALLDNKPLQYPTRFGIDENSAKGDATIDLNFHVPMVRDLSVDAVGIDVVGNVSGLALTVGDRSVSDGEANFRVDNHALHVAGNVSLAGVPLTASWDEAFDSKGADAATTHVTASGVLDDAARSKLGIDTGDHLTGPIHVDAQLQGHRGTIRSADIDADLAPAVLDLGLINYTKPAGVAAKLHVTAHFMAGSGSSDDLTLSGAGLAAQGRATIAPDGTLERLDLSNVRAGPQNDFALRMSQTAQGGLRLFINGRSIDGTGLGKLDLSDKTRPAAPSRQPFHLQATLERVAMRDGVTLAPFALSTTGVGRRLESLALSGTLSKTAKLSGDLVTVGGERRLRLETGNAGLLLKGLFGFTSMHGGKLHLTAALSPAPTRNELAQNKVPDYRGVLTIKNFTIVNQPFLTRLFSAGSLGGLIDLMSGKGIAIDTLEAPFRMHGGVLDIHDAYANGPSVGISAQGYLDRRNDKLALEGALAPIYGLNSVLGAIPVLGDVLVSKKGEGIIGMSYSAKGEADAPSITVNPLSVLTPGIFRRIFEGTPQAPASVEAKAPEKKAQPKKE